MDSCCSGLSAASVLAAPSSAYVAVSFAYTCVSLRRVGDCLTSQSEFGQENVGVRSFIVLG